MHSLDTSTIFVLQQKNYKTHAHQVDDSPDTYTLKSHRLKITQLEKERFIKVNEQILTEAELFQFFHFLCVAASAS